MTDRPVSVAFFDPSQRLSGTVRAGVALVFEGKSPTTIPDPEIDSSGERVAVRFDDNSLELSPASPPAELAGAITRVANVHGTVAGRRINCLGTITETETPPTWSELDAVRAVSAVFDADHAVFAVARRPQGARGHGDETVEAKLLLGGALVDAEDARISTVYDADGRQRTAGLELWLSEEDFPRRASGSVEAGCSLTLEGLRVNAAVFRWRMEGRDGLGLYELAVRERIEAA